MIKEYEDALILICEKASRKEIGTGFFINKEGHFVTAFHIVSGKKPQEDLFCIYKGRELNILLIEGLEDFYIAQKTANKIDITIFKAQFTNSNFKIKWLPLHFTTCDNSSFKTHEIIYSGFHIYENGTNKNAEIKSINGSISAYNNINGVYNILSQSSKFINGFSGSALIHKELNEVIGVVIQKDTIDNQFGYAQSIHMLVNELKKCNYSFENVSGYFQKILDQFKENTRLAIVNERWPYEIDKDVFVDCFDFNKGSFDNYAEAIYKDSNCIEEILKILDEENCFCIAYYGMGKTTIAKSLFEKVANSIEGFFPIFISLSGKDLSSIYNLKLEDFIYEILSASFAKDEEFLALKEDLKEYLTQRVLFLIRAGKVLLIFDGIDESNYNQGTLKKFADYLNTLDCRFFLTSRKEFVVFFDTFSWVFYQASYSLIELEVWGEKQWLIYTSNLLKKYPEKKNKIKDLFESLRYKDFGELPSRPLFLKMICDLILIDGNTQEIPKELLKNRSAIYYRYLNWKIIDDFYRKGGLEKELIAELFKNDCFTLFKRLALKEYSKTVNSHKDNSNTETENWEGKGLIYGFSIDEIIDSSKDLRHINSKFVYDYIFKSTFFSTIRVLNKSSFTFSHKSFSEYLTAYNLADCIFKEKPEDAICDNSWGLYQTFEVSAHFKDEVERICFQRNISEKLKNEYFRFAFEKVLSVYNDWKIYDEKVEEVLYYSGKYKINSDKITKQLQYLVENNKQIAPIYYRTASISLSYMLDRKYCEEYVLKMFDSNLSDIHFEKNKDIQLNYYGKSLLRPKLKEEINEYIYTDKSSDIISLKILTYFAVLDINENEKNEFTDFLNLILSVSIKRNDENVKKICHLINLQILCRKNVKLSLK